MSSTTTRPTPYRSDPSRCPVSLNASTAYAAHCEAAALNIPLETLLDEAVAAYVKKLQHEREAFESRAARLHTCTTGGLERRLNSLLGQQKRTRYEEIELCRIGRILDERAAADAEGACAVPEAAHTGYYIEYDAIP